MLLNTTIDIMPGWLNTVSLANPLTYEVDVLRALILTGETSRYAIGVDCLVLLTISTAFVAIAMRMYPRLTM